MSAENVRLATLSAQIDQIQREIVHWQQQERNAATQLNTALAHLQQCTRMGQLPDPMVHVAVNSHSVALNRIRSTLAGLYQRKANAEREHVTLSRQIRGGWGY